MPKSEHKKDVGEAEASDAPRDGDEAEGVRTMLFRVQGFRV